MAYGIVSNSSLANQTFARPSVTSYDSGYEHSLDHYVDVKLRVQDADKKTNSGPATLAAA
jgi:hypothetical protein